MKIISILKKARRKLKLSQRDFARFLGISKSAYNRYELGKRIPPKKVIEKCCCVLGIKIYFRRAEDLIKFCKNKFSQRFYKKNNRICKKLEFLRWKKMFHLKKISNRSDIPYWKCCGIFSGRIVPSRKEVSKLTRAMNFSPKILRENNFKKFFKTTSIIFDI
jgi:transcriptional regulator with XRE-family HTH domain